MNFEPIIKHFDDQDSYKFTMNYLVFKHFYSAKTEWWFFNRGKHKVPEGFDKLLRQQVESFEDLKFTQEIENHFKKVYIGVEGEQLFDESYYQFLRYFKYKPEQVIIKQYGENLELSVKESYYRENQFWETQLMPVISELYYKTNNIVSPYSDEELDARDRAKFDKFRQLNAKIVEGGTRRRFSEKNHDRVLKLALSEYQDVFLGTSNVYFNRKYDSNRKPFGSCAHELNMALSTMYGIVDCSPMLLDLWIETFKGNLLTALPDCYTSEIFFKKFNLIHSKLFDVLRQDSGLFKKFTDLAHEHYQQKKIDTRSKTILYSDSINSHEKVEDMLTYKSDLFKILLMIGTWISNDVGVPPTNFVIKLSSAQMGENLPKKYVSKLSDDMGKFTYTNEDALNENILEAETFLNKKIR